MTDDLKRRLQKFIRDGGALLASGFSGVSEDGKTLTLPELPIKPLEISPFETTYIRFGREISADVPPTDHVMYERGVRVLPAQRRDCTGDGGRAVFRSLVEAFLVAFPDARGKVSRFSAAVMKDRMAYIAYPIFSAFDRHGNVPFKLLVRNIIDHFSPSRWCASPPPAEPKRRCCGRRIARSFTSCIMRRSDGPRSWIWWKKSCRCSTWRCQ